MINASVGRRLFSLPSVPRNLEWGPSPQLKEFGVSEPNNGFLGRSCVWAHWMAIILWVRLLGDGMNMRSLVFLPGQIDDAWLEEEFLWRNSISSHSDRMLRGWKSMLGCILTSDFQGFPPPKFYGLFYTLSFRSQNMMVQPNQQTTYADGSIQFKMF